MDRSEIPREVKEETKNCGSGGEKNAMSLLLFSPGLRTFWCSPFSKLGDNVSPVYQEEFISFLP